MGLYSIQNGGVTTTAAATKSLLLVNPATDRIKVVEWGVSFDNVSTNAEPVLIEIYRTNSLGSPAGTSTLTPLPLDPADATASATALYNLSTEPTSVYVLGTYYVAPNAGLLVIQYPLGREIVCGAAGARFGIRYTTVTGVTPGCRAYAIWEE